MQPTLGLTACSKPIGMQCSVCPWALTSGLNSLLYIYIRIIVQLVVMLQALSSPSSSSPWTVCWYLALRLHTWKPTTSVIMSYLSTALILNLIFVCHYTQHELPKAAKERWTTYNVRSIPSAAHALLLSSIHVHPGGVRFDLSPDFTSCTRGRRLRTHQPMPKFLDLAHDKDKLKPGKVPV